MRYRKEMRMKKKMFGFCLAAAVGAAFAVETNTYYTVTVEGGT